MRISQMGNSHTDFNHQPPNLYKKLSEQRETSNSPTLNRNVGKNLTSAGVKKVQTQQSIKGNLNKIQRDSMGDAPQ
jgi:hypothetical protein